MAGHSKFKNIMHRKNAQDNKRAKRFTKLIREITAAAKIGNGDPDFNPRLRVAIATARAANLPKDKIDNAIKKGTSSLEGEGFEEVRYECYAADGAALIVEGLTDNRNRTASEIKAVINKIGAILAEPGSVIFMFERVGYILFHNGKISDEKILEAALEAGAIDCESDEDTHVIYTNPEDFNEVRDKLAKDFGDPEEARLLWKPKNIVEVDDQDSAEKIIKLVESLEDLDDVQYVSGNYTISDRVLEKMNV
jgi:YebC/PmpR family DNA-binding regulatory protein